MAKRSLPSLNAIKAFEAVARYESFTKAAEELCLTQSALSKQVGILEDYLGCSLFQRLTRKIIPTKEAKKYYNEISKALNIIEAATSEVNKGNEKIKDLHINVMPSLSSYWLMPNIKKFKNSHPDINIQITTGEGSEIDFQALGADVAIRSNVAPYKNVQSEFLMSEEVALVGSSCILEDGNVINEKDDLLKYPLLDYMPYPYMKKWLEQSGFNHKSAQKALEFEHFFMLIEAIKQGLGFGFVPNFLVAKELKSGEFINPLNIHYRTDFSYYILYPKYSPNLYNITSFIRWMKHNINRV